MIRANLLPHPKEAARLFGVAIDRDHLHQALAGLTTAAIVASIGIAIEEVRIDRLRGVAIVREATFAERATQRETSKRLALDVARYQEFAREADAFRRSGSSAAVAVARIGNALPAPVWLESLDRDAEGYVLTGGSQSIDSLSGTILSLGDALPHSGATLLSIDNQRNDRGGVRFRVHVTSPDAAATPETSR